MFTTPGALPEVPGEIKPASVSQSATYNNNVAQYGADKAIDRDLSTLASAQKVDSNGVYSNAWFRASLDTEHCIKQVVHYWTSHVFINSVHLNTHTCSKDTCTCEGGQCSEWPLTVYHEHSNPEVSGDNVPSGCKLGDTVEINDNWLGYISVHELVIIAQSGNVLNSLILCCFSGYHPETYQFISYRRVMSYA